VVRHDYIKRLIEQLAEAVARVVAQRDEGDLEAAADELQRAYAALGFQRSFLKLDTRSLALLLGNDADRIAALRQLLELEAILLHARGDTARALELHARAIELRSANSSGNA
jgi:L-alanine-DL-glutamate epimerase-like enolase superfamily enzyme